MSVTEEAGERFRDLIAQRFGLRFEDGKLGFLDQLLHRRAEQQRLSPERYLEGFDKDAAEAGALAEELTVGETYFFRNIDQLNAFRDVALPDALRAKAEIGQLNFLSAGCSTGEEPYSLAMLISAAVPSPPWRVSITAADLNPASLKRAMAGRYGSWSLRDTPPDIMAQWFTSNGRDMQLNDELRAMVKFERHNLADPHAGIWRDGAYDAIFCRNVIMYFTPSMQHQVIERIARSLVPGGYLFLGHAETLRGLSSEFHLVHTHNTFYYQRRGGDVRARDPVPQADPASYLPYRPPVPVPNDTSWYEAIGEATKRIEALFGPAAATPQPATPQWNLEAALDLLQRERFSEALALIARMPAEAAQDPDVLLLQALLLVQDGKLAAAGNVCRLLLAVDEMNAGANHVLGLCFEGLDDARKAIHQYGIAIHLDPHFGGIL